MIIESLNLSNFRNYDYLDLALAPGVNLFYGDNAQGKTNILESLFVAATTKSHRGSKDKEMIKIGAEDAHIKLMVKKRNLQNRYFGKNMRSAVRGLRAMTDKNEALAKFPEVQKMLDRMAKRGLIHKNKAANLKSGLCARIAKLA